MAGGAAVLWTGGKDSSLALHEAEATGYPVKHLVTFVPLGAEFLAHPLSVMKYQAEALGLPHHTLEITEPFKESYENAIRTLKVRFDINTLITGDIAEADGRPHWITECSISSRVEVLTPLWGCDRQELIEQLLSRKFQVIFSCVKKPWFTIEWLGRELNKNSLGELLTLSIETGLDVCGEQGEYHTLVLDGPLFKKRIRIDKYSKETRGPLMYLHIQEVSLV